MPPRKAAVRNLVLVNIWMTSHPELQTGYWKNQVMTYDSAVAIERNEIDFMLQSLQTDLSDDKQTWVLSLSNCRMFLLSWLSIS